MAKKIWITAAITGAVHTPTLSPYLPLTPQQIIDESVKAYKAGAAVVHIHSRDPETGRPIPNLEVMKEIIGGIKKQCDVIICVTTGGAMGMGLEDRLAPIPIFKPELASLNAGSINFVFSPLADKVREKGPQFDWEMPFLEATYDLIFANTFYTIENYCRIMNENATRPELEVYDVGMINNIAYFINKGLIKSPPYIQFVLGVLGGLPATVENLAYLVRTAREQLGEFFWSCASTGRNQFPISAATLALGGNVRVGLEDNLYLEPDIMAATNAEQVIRVKEIAVRLGLEIASSNEVREIMGLKGTKQVNF